MRIVLALAVLAGCASRVPPPSLVVNVPPLTPPPPAEPPPAPPPAPAPPSAASPELLADSCRVVAIDGEDGKPRPDLVRVECEPPVGTPGADSLAAALFAAAAEGVARDRIWFVYRISPAEQVPVGQFRIAVLYWDSAEAFDRARVANSDPASVYTSAPEVMPPEAYLMHQGMPKRDGKAALAHDKGTRDPFEDDDTPND